MDQVRKAYELLDNILGQLQIKRNEHQAVQEALRVLYSAALDNNDSKEVSKESPATNV